MRITPLVLRPESSLTEARRGSALHEIADIKTAIEMGSLTEGAVRHASSPERRQFMSIAVTFSLADLIPAHHGNPGRGRRAVCHG